MRISRRDFVLAPVATGLPLSHAAFASPGKQFRPEDFGAKGDGISNDADAFTALATAVAIAGGGMIILRRTTYIVGKQIPAFGPGGWAFSPVPVLEFKGLSGPLAIEGNGARLRCAPGLRYGTFDRRTGEPTKRPMPNSDESELATPYTAMVRITGCTGPILIEDLELDGNIAALRIGGPFGDAGHQIPAIGLFLADNRGTEIVRRLYTHHHGQDGLEISGDDRREIRSSFEDISSEYNGRQGLSMIGGRGYDFLRCRFSHTGRSTIQSPPSAGVDIEAEGEKINRDFTFKDCEFVDNAGCGMVAEAGDNADMKFVGCKFVGTSAWSAWPRKPRMMFSYCTFVGAVVNCFASKMPNDATRFYNCRFFDDPSLSPTGKVYRGGDPDGPIVNMGQSDNVLFSRCRFVVTHGAQLPWSWRAVYKDCTMIQTSAVVAHTKGLFLGRNEIKGQVELYNSKIEGVLTVNGQTMRQGLSGGSPW